MTGLPLCRLSSPAARSVSLYHASPRYLSAPSQDGQRARRYVTQRYQGCWYSGQAQTGWLTRYSEYCPTLHERLPVSIDSAAIDTLLSELQDKTRFAEKYLKKPTTVPNSLRAEVDRQATALWNLASRLVREDDKGLEPRPARTSLLLRVRYFAFLLVDVARCSGGSVQGADLESDELFRVLKLALRMAKYCISGSRLPVRDLNIG